MKQDKNQLPTRLEAGGVCFQGHDWGELNVARVRFPAGADATPLLEGLPGNMCQFLSLTARILFFQFPIECSGATPWLM